MFDCRQHFGYGTRRQRAGGDAVGVFVGGEITATGTAAITIVGTGGNASGTSSYNETGVYSPGTSRRTTAIYQLPDKEVAARGVTTRAQMWRAKSPHRDGHDYDQRHRRHGQRRVVFNEGVFMFTGVSRRADGNISITGQGGSSLNGHDWGVYVDGQVTSTGTATITITGTGGTTSGTSATGETGVCVYRNGSFTSAAGNISVTGQGGSSAGARLRRMLRTAWSPPPERPRLRSPAPAARRAAHRLQ